VISGAVEVLLSFLLDEPTVDEESKVPGLNEGSAPVSSPAKESAEEKKRDFSSSRGFLGSVPLLATGFLFRTTIVCSPVDVEEDREGEKGEEEEEARLLEVDEGAPVAEANGGDCCGCLWLCWAACVRETGEGVLGDWRTWEESIEELGEICRLDRLVSGANLRSSTNAAVADAIL